MSKKLRSLFPPITPIKEHHLEVGKIAEHGKCHVLYVAEYGNPDGIPAIISHGGPGAGTPAFYAYYFDPKKYRIIVYDQRGAGKSMPAGCLIDNSTPYLIEDMEKIRRHLGVDKWIVFGGSWGATLSLLYAEAHPERVLGIILRGIFLARDQDLPIFLKDDSPAALLRPFAWKKFKTEIQKIMREANLKFDPNDMLRSLYCIITQAPYPLQEKMAMWMSWWELGSSYLDPNMQEVEDWSRSQDGVNMGRIEITFLKQRCFIGHNQIIDESYKLKNLPIYIIHGNWDVICPPNQAHDLLMAMSEHDVTYFPTLAGHSASEPENIHYLIEATEGLAQKLKNKYNWQD